MIFFVTYYILQNRQRNDLSFSCMRHANADVRQTIPTQTNFFRRNLEYMTFIDTCYFPETRKGNPLNFSPIPLRDALPIFPAQTIFFLVNWNAQCSDAVV